MAKIGISNCNLFVIGNNETGKTSLISSLFELTSRSRRDQTHFLEYPIDLIIEEKENNLNIEIKESATFSRNMTGLSSKNNNAVLLFVRIDATNVVTPLNDRWVSLLQKTPEETLLMVVFNFVNPKDSRFNINTLKKKYPFFKYFFAVTNELDKARAEMLNVAYSLKQILINNFTERLGFAKNLVRENFFSKDKILDLGNCGLTSLDEIDELFHNTHLETLILSNEWGEFYDKEWIRRESENQISPNIIYNLSKNFFKLKNLKVLICGGNWSSKRRKLDATAHWHITDASVVGNLTKLSILNLSNNDIDSTAFVKRLVKLTRIYLNNNQISNINSISSLVAVKEIYLSNNRIIDIRYLRSLKNVKAVDLHSNLINDIYPLKDLINVIGIKDSKWENTSISISKNPLDSSVFSVIGKGKRSISAYFRKLEAEQKIKLKPFRNNDIKLILVGNSSVGKSTLASWLINEKVDKTINTTHWMDIKIWIAKHNGLSLNVRIFDFGGQEYYHDTHHLFFTNRTAYVLLWDEKSNHFDEIKIEQQQIDKSLGVVDIQTFPLEYWLDSISFHTKRRIKTETEKEIENLLDRRDKLINESVKIGGDWVTQVLSAVSNVDSILKSEENIIIVQNKVDQQTDKRFLNESQMKTQNEKIYDFAAISVFKERGLNSFKNKLFEVFKSLDIVNQDSLGTWGYVKEQIEKQEFLKPCTLVEFKNYCNLKIKEIPELAGKKLTQVQQVLFDDNDAKLFAEYLADIGVALFYPEKRELRNKVFLNQNRIVHSIYEILFGLAVEKGEFTTDKVTKALKKKRSDNDVTDVLELMLHFKIIFKHPSKADTFIAPLYLPKKPAQSIAIFSSLFSKPIYRYKYQSFIHKSVVLDFFNSYGEKALKESAVTDLYYYWREGIIIKDEKTEEIVMVKFFPGSTSGEKAFIDIFAISKRNPDTFIQQIVEDLDKINEGWPVEKQVTANGEDFLPLNLILESEESNNWIFQYRNIIYKLTDFKKFLKGKPKMKKVFISYSKADSQHLMKFENHLSMLRRNGTIETWNCRKLLPGEKWDGKIKQELEEANLIIFLVSDDFLATDYIWDVEIKRAIERDNDPTDSVTVVPIIVRDCDWQDSPLAIYNTAPKKAEIINSADDIDVAWTKVVRELKQIL